MTDLIPLNLPEHLKHVVNLATPRLGAAAIACSDEFFAAKERIIADEPAVFVADKYDSNGKWMDGWESRRRRQGGHDWCVIKLGCRGVIEAVDIDTSHFTGNYPPAASLEACDVAGEPDATTAWSEILSPAALGPSAHHILAVASAKVWSHVRLNIFPDGGVARLRIYGRPVASWANEAGGADRNTVHELSLLDNGGRIVGYNNAHYGTTWTLLTRGRGHNMGDGWETRRRREPGNDWIVIELGAAGIIDSLEVDTCHFKGNFPDRCSVQAASMAAAPDSAIINQAMFWPEIVGETKLSADAIHKIAGDKIKPAGPVTHVKLNIFPDGGVSRLRVFGRLA